MSPYGSILKLGIKNVTEFQVIEYTEKLWRYSKNKWENSYIGM